MAIIYVDPILGKSKRVCTFSYASNPTGTITRITQQGVKHCLTTGDQVILSNFTAWLNGTWTITVEDDYRFTLNGAVWQATADPNGTVTPVNILGNDGSTWAQAILSLSNQESGGNEFRICKSPINSLGINANWTYRSQILTLASALTQEIDPATVTTGWVASTNVTLSTNSSRKYGASAFRASMAALFTNGKVCYKTLAGTLDLSGYQKISFWAYLSTPDAGKMKICLCSDATGDVPVNTFYFNSFGMNNQMQAFTIDNGGALGANINSIAIYREDNMPVLSIILINNIIACNELSLNTIVGKSNDRTAQFYPIQSINGTTILFDNGAFAGSVHKGYDGTTETAEVFYIQPLPAQSDQADFFAVQTNAIQIKGGWDKDTDIQDGISWIDLLHSYKGVGQVSGANTVVEHFGFVRGRMALSCSFIGSITNILTTGLDIPSSVVMNPASTNSVIDNIKLYMTQGYFEFRGNLGGIIKNVYSGSNSISGTGIGAIRITGTDTYYENIYAKNNAKSGLVIVAGAIGNYVKNVTIEDSEEVSYVLDGNNNTLENIVLTGAFSSIFKANLNNINTIKDSDSVLSAGYTANEGSVFNDGRVAGAHLYIIKSRIIKWQTEVKHGIETGAWHVSNTGSSLLTGTEKTPRKFKIAEIAAEAGVQLVIRVWVRGATTNDHIAIHRLTTFCIDQDYFTYAQNLGTLVWQELSITIVPERTGVLSFEYISTGETYIGSISIS